MKASASALCFLWLVNSWTKASGQFADNEDRSWIGGISYCGCRDCDQAAYDKQVDGHSCSDRILNLIFDQGMTEEDACAQVANTEYPNICGPACDPGRCDGRDAPRPIPVSQSINPPLPTFCGCQFCTEEVWNRKVGYPAYTCGARIEYLKSSGLNQAAACHEVARNQFPLQEACGPCDPELCGLQAAPEPKPAVALVSASQGVARPVSAIVPSTRCGCPTCTESVLSTMASGFLCSERIDYLASSQSHLYPTEEDACHQIHMEFPNECGPQCDPTLCNDLGSKFSGNSAQAATVPANSNGSGSAFSGSSAGTVTANSRSGSLGMDLYCFPPTAFRQTFDNVWGKYTLQVKSDSGPCGPGNNFFSTQTVALANNGRDLKLQYKKAGNQWQGSEVRVLLPESEMPYQYGTYTFSVKSVQVLDSQSGSVVGTILPPSLILGMFTWDPLEDYGTNENMNHEVDVEISRWNVPGNADGQFLVQPPGDPQKYRFFTGENGNSYQQAPRIYGWDWRPTEVEWYSNSGDGGQRFVYSTQDALDAGAVDYNQCMPANVEVRINLWDLYGGTSNPPEMADTHVVEVLIDSFQFTPSGLTAVADGHVCSKDCHCEPTSRCLQNQCSPIARNGGTRRQLTSQAKDGSSLNSITAVPIVLFLVIGNLIAYAAFTNGRRHS